MNHPNVIWLNFSDPDLADTLVASKPPKGIKVSKVGLMLECSAPAELTLQVVISFALNVAGSLVAAWIVSAMQKRGNKTSRINRQQIVLNKRGILALIKKELASQKRQDAQRPGPKKNTRKKR